MSIVEPKCLGKRKGHDEDSDCSPNNYIRRIPSNNQGPHLWPMDGLPFIERKNCEDPYRIKLIRPPLKKNLCFFTACLNVLGSDEERLAFCCGDLENPSKVFESLYSQINEDGYTGQDILQYLKFLKAEGHIKGFEWRKFTNFRWPNIVLTEPFPVNTTLIFDCTSASKELFAEIQPKLKAIEFLKSPNGKDTQTVYSKTGGYKRNKKVERGTRWAKDSKAYVTKTMIPSLKTSNQDKYHTKNFLQHRHAFGIRWVPWYGAHAPTMDSVKDGNGTPVIFDNRWENSHQALPDDLYQAAYNVMKMYAFRLYL